MQHARGATIIERGNNSNKTLSTDNIVLEKYPTLKGMGGGDIIQSIT